MLTTVRLKNFYQTLMAQPVGHRKDCSYCQIAPSKKAIRKSVSTINIGSFGIKYKSMNIQQIIHQHFYPFYIRGWAERFFKVGSGQIVIDAGSYLGGFTFYAATKVGKVGKVIAFEPDPRNFGILKTRVDSSKTENIILINKALGNTVKDVELESANHFSSVIIKTSKRPTFKIQQTTLDNEMENLGINKVDFIKMNIEGAEIDTIKGAKKTLLNTNHLAISCHIVEGRNTANIIKPMLEESGFKVKVLKRKRLIIDFGHIDVYGSR